MEQEQIINRETYESRRDDLSPEVKSYLDNLFEQIKQLYLEHNVEVFDHETFINEAPIDVVRQLAELSKTFLESLQTDTLPPGAEVPSPEVLSEEDAYYSTLANSLLLYIKRIIKRWIKSTHEQQTTFFMCS